MKGVNLRRRGHDIIWFIIVLIKGRVRMLLGLCEARLRRIGA